MPWIRSQPYVVGIQLGILLHLTRNERIKISQALNFVLWILSLALIMIVVYGLDMYKVIQDPEYYSKLANVSYQCFHRLAYSLALSWLVFACFHGYGGNSRETLIALTMIKNFHFRFH